MSAAYLIRRFLLMIPTFIGITLLVFLITRYVPGGPRDRILSQANQQSLDGGGSSQSMGGSGSLSADQLKQLDEFYGFNEPALTAYLKWFKNLVTFNLGVSTRYNDPVWTMIKERMPISLFYGLVSMILTYIVCIPLGIIKAIKHKTTIDNVTSILIFVGYAIPGFVFALLLLVWFAGHFDFFPLGGFVSDDYQDLNSLEKIWDVIHHAILPLAGYMVGSFAVMTMMTKNSLMDHLSADYVRTAMAKGLTFKSAVLKHALRNSLIPIATHFGNNISLILTGSLLIEKIFDIDGFGLLSFESVVERDYPVVMGILAISALLQLVGNIISDICVAVVDPRVQFN